MLLQQAQPLFDVIKHYYTIFGIGGAVVGAAWALKLAGNHLDHIQKSTGKMADEISLMRESHGRMEAQHDEQIRLLTNIDTHLRK